MKTSLGNKMATDAAANLPVFKDTPWVLIFNCDTGRSDVLAREGELSCTLKMLIERALKKSSGPVAMGSTLHALLYYCLSSARDGRLDKEKEIAKLAKLAEVPIEDIKAMCEYEGDVDGEPRWKHMRCDDFEAWNIANGFPSVRLVRFIIQW